MSVWSLVGPENFLLRAWSGEDAAVVHDIRSGDTHLIESPGPELLELLAQSPATAGALTCKLEGLFMDDDPATIAQWVDGTLLRLQSVGLISDTPS